MGGHFDAFLGLGARFALVRVVLGSAGAQASGIQETGNTIGRLCANAEPVLRTLGVDLDDAGVEHRLVDADLFDGTAITCGARIGDHDAVLRCMDLADALELDLYGHGGLSPVFRGGTRTRLRGDTALYEDLVDCHVGGIEGQPGGKTRLFCQIPRALVTTALKGGP